MGVLEGFGVLELRVAGFRASLSAFSPVWGGVAKGVQRQFPMLKVRKLNLFSC